MGYHYRFFSDRNVIDRLTTNQLLAIKSFMLRNGLRQVAGSVAAGRRSKAISLAKWIASVVPVLAASHSHDAHTKVCVRIFIQSTASFAGLALRYVAQKSGAAARCQCFGGCN